MKEQIQNKISANQSKIVELTKPGQDQTENFYEVKALIRANRVLETELKVLAHPTAKCFCKMCFPNGVAV